MNISMGCDHGAYHLKEHLKAYLEGQGHQVVDCGCHSTESVDYPVFCKAAAEQVTSGACERAIVLCTTGIGASIAATTTPTCWPWGRASWGSTWPSASPTCSCPPSSRGAATSAAST